MQRHFIHDSVHSPVNACDTKGNQARKLPLLEVTIYTNIRYAIHKYTKIFTREYQSITNYKNIIQTELQKAQKLAPTNFPPQKISTKKNACFRVFLSVFALFRLFFACFSQKLAPARKNSTDWSARSARFCNSV